MTTPPPPAPTRTTPPTSKARVVIPAPKIEPDGSSWRYSWEARIEGSDGSRMSVGGAWFRSTAPIIPRSGTGNAAVAASLVPLMRLGLPVVVQAPVSPRLLRNISLWQTAFSSWYPELTPVPISIDPQEQIDVPGDSPPRGEAVYCSLGVDSWHSIRRHLSTIDHLVYLDGFDLTQDQVAARAEMRAATEEAASILEKPLIVIESNLREWIDRWADWKITHGTFLGAVGLLLEGQLHTVWQPSSATSLRPDRCGSNALTDPLFSTESLRIVYDGGDLSRLDKLLGLLDWPIAMDRLHVCWSGSEGLKNCGRCPKCVRTMLAIFLLARPEIAPLFPPTLDPDLVARFPMAPVNLAAMNDIMRSCRFIGTDDHPLARAVVARIQHYQAEAAMEPGGALDRIDANQWNRLGRRHREVLAEDLMNHAPETVDRILLPVVDRAPLESINALWKKDRHWLQRQVAGHSRRT